MASIPQDIVLDILVRLPTKPLVRFRCLSKQWNHLISDCFINSRSRRMIFLPFQSFQAIHNTVPHSTSSLPCPFNTLGSEDRVRVVGTFNGIVVLFCKKMLLLNPLTGAFKIVPDPPLDSNSHRADTYGLCHGATLDDLKIVKLRLGIDYYSCDVFSLRKGLWSTKSIRLEGRYCVNACHSGTFVNGFLYWHAIRRNNLSFALALNVKEMVSSVIQLPCFSWEDSLCTLSGRLHVFHIPIMDDNPKYELWVMNEDGIEKTWSKVLTSNSFLLSVSRFPMSVIDAETIVMSDCKRQIIIYNMLKDSSYDVHNVKWIVGSLGGSQAIEYVESLISPSHLFSTW